MARIRSIKPEVRISEKVNSWPIECRYFWVLLWGYCDDYGYGRDNLRLVKADTFPLDDDVTLEMIALWMDVLWKDEVIERFIAGGSQYFRVVNWGEHQKISHPAKQVLPTIEQATEVLRRITGELPKEPPKASPKQGAGSREQGGGERSPFCAAHPQGSNGVKCPQCGDARRLFDSATATTKAKPTPTPPRASDYCVEHDWLLRSQCTEMEHRR